MTDNAEHRSHGPWSDQIYRQQMGDLDKALFVESWLGAATVMNLGGFEFGCGMIRLDGLTNRMRDKDARTILVPHDIARDLGRRLIRVERDWQSGERRPVPPFNPSPSPEKGNQ